MEISPLTRKILALCVTAALSSGVTYWCCSSKYESEIQKITEHNRILEDSVLNANVTKRVSEQLEEIAYQQKSIADTARQKAVFESQKAFEQAQRAENERRNALLAKDMADKAEAEARKQAAEAEQERYEAQMARDAANLQKEKADTLRYVSLGHSLAQSSITQFEAGKYDMAQLLAYAGYAYTVGYGGNPYRQDIFEALLDNAHNARTKMGNMTGSVKAVKCVHADEDVTTNDDDFVALTDYGQISLFSLKPKKEGHFDGFYSKVIFNDNRYFFCDMCMRDSMIYALDVNGRLLYFNMYQGKESYPVVLTVASSTRKSERWFRLLRKRDGNLIAVGEHQICWIDTKKNAIYRESYIDEKITEAGIGDGKLIVFTKLGKYYTFHEGEPVKWPVELPESTFVTSYFYYRNAQLHALGTENGNIYFYNNSGKRKGEMTGHQGPVTHMDNFDNFFVSASYDRTIRIWNLEQMGGYVTPIEIKCESWPLAFDVDNGVKTIRVGYATGIVESVRLSVYDNAASVQRRLTRDFTPQEWRYYVGRDEPRLYFDVKKK